MLYVYFKCGEIPSRECAEVAPAPRGEVPLWARAAGRASYHPLCCTHSLVLAHNSFSACFQSGETQHEQRCFGSLEKLFLEHEGLEGLPIIISLLTDQCSFLSYIYI